MGLVNDLEVKNNHNKISIPQEAQLHAMTTPLTCNITVSMGACISMASVYQASSWFKVNLSLIGNWGRAERV